MFRFPWILSGTSGRKCSARSVPSRKPQRRPHLSVEALEERLVPASMAAFLPPPPVGVAQDSFRLVAVPSVQAGSLVTVNVSEVDPTGAVIASGGAPGATITLSENGTTAPGGTIALTNGTGQISLPLNNPGTMTVEASYTINPPSGSGDRALTIAGQTSIVVLPPEVVSQYSFTVVTPPSVQAGSSFAVSVSERDSAGNIVRFGGVSSATLTVRESGMTLLNESIAFSDGVSSPSLTLNDVGTATIEASYVVNTGSGGRAVTITGQTSIVVTAPTESSSNWSGYVVNSTQGGTTAVGGTWVQPAVSGTDGAEAAMWVGIDGLGDHTVEQIGTDAKVVNGQTQVTAWYEFYGDQGPYGLRGPAYSAQTLDSSFVVHPGDIISADVVFLSNTTSYSLDIGHTAIPFATSTFLFQMADVPARGGAVETWSSQETTSYIQPARSSAEWIVEGTSAPLANFGTATFTGAWATIGGTTGAINDFSNAQEWNMDQGPRESLVQNNPPNYSASPGFNEPGNNLGSSSFSLHWQMNFANTSVGVMGGPTSNGGAHRLTAGAGQTAAALATVFGSPAGVTPSTAGAGQTAAAMAAGSVPFAGVTPSTAGAGQTAGPLHTEPVPAAALALALDNSFLPTSHLTSAHHGGETICPDDAFWADLAGLAPFDALWSAGHHSLRNEG